MKTSFQRSNPARDPGFTRIELAALLGTVLLLVSVAYPLLAATKTDTARVLCLNNLRQIGQAYGGWKTEHNDAMPQQVPYPVGMLYHPLRQNPAVHFLILSNHLATPQRLACPGDPAARVAQDWSSTRGRGLAPPAGVGDYGISYFVGLHCLPDYPGELAAGDYRLVGAPLEQCDLAAVVGNSVAASAQVGWTNYPHPSAGNLLFNDGRAVSATATQLRAMLRASDMHEADKTHVLPPNR